MRLLTSIIIVLFLNSSIYSQNIKGTLLDKESLAPITFAEVYFPELKTGTVTDIDGHFEINHFAQKEIHIQIHYLGYKPLDIIVNLEESNNKTFYLEEDHLKLDEVLVTASTGKLQGENVVAIQHKKLASIKLTSPLNLAEAITNIPGVDQNTTGAGIGKPVIRGLSGNRIVTYAQGIRVENQQWGSEHGLGIGDIGIESVEVIKGPASLLYGADALGGVLYFIDERYAPHNTIEVRGATKYLSNTQGTLNNLTFKIHKGKIKFNLFGALNSHADFSTPKDGHVFNTRFNEKNIKTALGFNTKNWISNLRYSYLDNNFGIAEEALWIKDAKRKIILPSQSIVNHAVSVDNIIFINDSKIDLKIGHSFNFRKEFSTDFNVADLALKLNTTTYNGKWASKKYGDKYKISLGSQGMLQTNKNEGAEILIPDATIKDFGVFGLFDIDVKEAIIQLGARIDTRNIGTKEMMSDEVVFPAFNKTYRGFTFSAGINYTKGASKWRFNTSSGFRAPNTSELLSNGIHEGTIRYEIGQQNLKNEKAIQVDAAYEYKSEHFNWAINPFINVIQNYIYLEPQNYMIDNNFVYTYTQTNALLYGGEVGFHYHPHSLHWLHIESDLSTVFANDKNNNPLPLIPQTKIQSTISAALNKGHHFKLKRVFFEHIYKMKQDRFSALETGSPAYNLFNIGGQFEVNMGKHDLNIEAGVKNLFDTKYIDHLSRFKDVNIPNPGINVYLGIKYIFKQRLKEKIIISI